jgi:phosphoribosylformylglycinamidine cyclo-ligase
MFRTFNCGIGMVLIVAQEATDDILERLRGLGEKAFLMGEVRTGNERQEQVIID